MLGLLLFAKRARTKILHKVMVMLLRSKIERLSSGAPDLSNLNRKASIKPQNDPLSVSMGIRQTKLESVVANKGLYGGGC